MTRYLSAMSVLLSVAVLSVALTVLSPAGCSKEQAAVPATQPATKSAGVVNAKCPIMGTAIDPAKVPADLAREYKGQKVGFCCSMCPPAWDKLTDAEKDAKLKAAMGK